MLFLFRTVQIWSTADILEHLHTLFLSLACSSVIIPLDSPWPWRNWLKVLVCQFVYDVNVGYGPERPWENCVAGPQRLLVLRETFSVGQYNIPDIL